jgi:hypothetical protein
MFYIVCIGKDSGEMHSKVCYLCNILSLLCVF